MCMQSAQPSAHPRQVLMAGSSRLAPRQQAQGSFHLPTAACQELLLPVNEQSFLLCDFSGAPVSWRMVLTTMPALSLYITAALLSFWGQTYAVICQQHRV